jgi:hypothetical protein
MSFSFNPFTGQFDYYQGSSGGNSFETIQVPSGTSPVAESSTDILTLIAGAGITITGDASTDTITIASTATQSVDLVSYTQFGGL